MSIQMYSVKEERLSAYLEQDELEKIIIEHIVKETGFEVGGKTIKKIYFSTKDCGSSGFKTSVRIELINNLLRNSEEKQHETNNRN